METLEDLGYELTKERKGARLFWREWRNTTSQHKGKRYSQIYIRGNIDGKGLIIHSKDGFTPKEWWATTQELKKIAKELKESEKNK